MDEQDLHNLPFPTVASTHADNVKRTALVLAQAQAASGHISLDLELPVETPAPEGVDIELGFEQDLEAGQAAEGVDITLDDLADPAMFPTHPAPLGPR